MTSEFVEGTTLAELLSRGSLPKEQAIQITCDVLAGLEEAHALGIVHRGITAGHVTVTRDGVVKLGGFGLAKPTSDVNLTRAGAVVGDARYMSPEQVTGVDALDNRADLYSVGVLLFYALDWKAALRRRQRFRHHGRTGQQTAAAAYIVKLGDYAGIGKHHPPVACQEARRPLCHRHGVSFGIRGSEGWRQASQGSCAPGCVARRTCRTASSRTGRTQVLEANPLRSRVCLRRYRDHCRLRCDALRMKTIRVGDVVGDYTVIDVAGAGGMGTVYKIEHTITKRVEAMKGLPPGLSTDPEQVRRFEREIQGTGSPSSPQHRRPLQCDPRWRLRSLW